MRPSQSGPQAKLIAHPWSSAMLLSGVTGFCNYLKGRWHGTSLFEKFCHASSFDLGIRSDLQQPQKAYLTSQYGWAS